MGVDKQMRRDIFSFVVVHLWWGAVSVCPSCGNGGGHCCPEEDVPIAPFPVLVTLDYCSLSMTQQTSLACVQGFGAGFSAQCCFAGTEESELILPLGCGYFLKEHKIETALQRVSICYSK